MSWMEEKASEKIGADQTDPMSNRCKRVYRRQGPGLKSSPAQPLKSHLSQIERIDKHIDHANRVTLVNEIIKAFRQQRPLPTIRLLNEAPRQLSPQNHERIIASSGVFTQPGRVEV